MGNSYQENPHFCLEEALAIALLNVTKGFERVPVEPVANEIVSLIKLMGLEVDNNDIDEFVEEHSQELTTEELMELHCVSQQEIVEFVRGGGGDNSKATIF